METSSDLTMLGNLSLNETKANWAKIVENGIDIEKASESQNSKLVNNMKKNLGSVSLPIGYEKSRKNRRHLSNKIESNSDQLVWDQLNMDGDYLNNAGKGSSHSCDEMKSSSGVSMTSSFLSCTTSFSDEDEEISESFRSEGFEFSATSSVCFSPTLTETGLTDHILGGFAATTPIAASSPVRQDKTSDKQTLVEPLSTICNANVTQAEGLVSPMPILSHENKTKAESLVEPMPTLCQANETQAESLVEPMPNIRQSNEVSGYCLFAKRRDFCRSECPYVHQEPTYSDEPIILTCTDPLAITDSQRENYIRSCIKIRSVMVNWPKSPFVKTQINLFDVEPTMPRLNLPYTNKGLLDLDQIYPCNHDNPCTVDRQIMKDQMMIQKYNALIASILKGTRNLVETLSINGF